MTKDITVSKLSQLQKRVLIHARQQMLAKGQKIEAPTEVTICMRAPPWLDKALGEAMRGIAKARQGYVLNPGPDAIFLTGLHPWMRPFAEMTVLCEQIEEAAEQAGVKDRIDLAALHALAFPPGFERRLRTAFPGRIKHHPWPYIDAVGWYFKIKITGLSCDQAKAELLMDGPPGVWAYDDGGGGPNCTISELLRDLFGFPVQEGGHIEALAFSVDAIGASRYSAAQASLRRACARLQARGLVNIWSGQWQSSSVFHSDAYGRTRIGLTEAGAAAADALVS
jgi:hypothetical protein